MRRWFSLLLIFGALIIPACARQPATKPQSPTEQAQKQIIIRVSYHDTSLPFAQDIKKGVDDAAKEFNVDAKLIGPAGGGADKQVAELETWLTKGVSGLAVSSASTDALAPVINKAIDMGVPVVTFNTDNPASKRLAFIGQDLRASGRAAAEQLVKHMGTKGKVIIFTLDASQQWSQDRIAGFKEVIEQYPDIQIVQIVNTGSETSQIYASVENAMLAHPDVTGIYATDCCTTPAVGKWILDNNRVGQYVVVGFDLLDQTLQQVKAGAITVAIGQNPYKQGYEAVRVLVDYLRNGVKPQNIDTGVEIVDSTNIDNYLK